ncbi:MAG: class I SAM-dependent methyltransferase [Proteobacteria bacterium]|nr:class I SAM-dependent methyltransferase [Pseudomonadota bacterium]
MKRTILKNPIEIPTTATVSFIESYVPAGGAILEVGCGAGHVASKLSMLGYEVTGIDTDEEAISQARRLDVCVVHASWPEINVDKVDAVVFTRSMHHISPLPEAVSKALKVLMPEGIVLVEDFAFDEVDSAAMDWFLKIVRSRPGQALISPKTNEFVTTLLNANDAPDAWHQLHDHDLHTADEMTRAMRDVFRICDIQRVPYLYRYLINVLPETPEATSFIEEVYLEESRLGKLGALPLIGHRIVAVAP